MRSVAFGAVVALGVVLGVLVGSCSDRADPLPFVAPSSVAAGARHSCALRDDGTVWCWGGGRSGQLGIGRLMNASDVPKQTEVLHDAVSVLTHGAVSCALRRGGQVLCWGYGELDAYAEHDLHQCESSFMPGWTYDCVLEPARIRGLSDVVQIAPRCALLVDGTVWCWAWTHGACDLEDLDPRLCQIPGIEDAVALANGQSHGCALLRDGTIRCWGDNYSGQLGNLELPLSSCDATGTHCDLPVPVTGIDDAVAVAVGDVYTCAIRADERVWCWGIGQMVGGDTDGQVPVPMRNIEHAQQVATGWGTGWPGEWGHACAVTRDGTVWCWGENKRGQLGARLDMESCSDRTGSATPVAVVGIDDAVQVAVGDEHTCATRADGSVWCWGMNLYHQLGLGVENEECEAPFGTYCCPNPRPVTWPEP